MATDELDAVCWLHSLFAEAQVTEKLNLCAIPAAMLVAAFAFDETVYTMEGCQRLLSQFASAVVAETVLPAGVMEIGNMIWRDQHPAAHTPRAANVVAMYDRLLQQARVSESNPASRLLSSKGLSKQEAMDTEPSPAIHNSVALPPRRPPARRPPALPTHTRVAPAPTRRPPALPSQTRVVSPPPSPPDAAAIAESATCQFDLYLLPAAVLQAAAVFGLGQDAFTIADATAQEMLRRLRATLARSDQRVNHGPIDLPPTVVQVARDLSANERGHRRAETPIALLQRHLETAVVVAETQKALSPHKRAVLDRAAAHLYEELGLMPSSLRLAALEQQLKEW